MVAGEALPAASVATICVGPEGCGVADVAEYVPVGPTGTVAVVPSGNVTLTDEPGSAAPDTVMVPFGFATVVADGARGAEVSTVLSVVAGDVFPAASLSTTVTVPDDCGAADVAVYVPLAATGTVAVVPSGNVTVTLEPGSPVPETFSVPLELVTTDAVGAVGAVVSA